jgi:hypothetical protein
MIHVLTHHTTHHIKTGQQTQLEGPAASDTLCIRPRRSFCIRAAEDADSPLQAPGGVRSRCRVASPFGHAIPDSLIYLPTLFLKRQCDRTLAPGPVDTSGGSGRLRTPAFVDTGVSNARFYPPYNLSAHGQPAWRIPGPAFSLGLGDTWLRVLVSCLVAPRCAAGGVGAVCGGLRGPSAAAAASAGGRAARGGVRGVAAPKVRPVRPRRRRHAERGRGGLDEGGAVILRRHVLSFITVPGTKQSGVGRNDRAALVQGARHDDGHRLRG